MFVLVLMAALGFAAPASAAPAPAAPAMDRYTVGDVKVDATAESAMAARDLAMSQGRPQAFTTLFRRFTSSQLWARQPQLDDNQLFRLILSTDIASERRSTTRYLADVTFHFNPNAVRQFLRASNIAFTDAKGKPALVIPLIEDRQFDTANPWAMTWDNPKLQDGLVPMVAPKGDSEDLATLFNPDLMMLNWDGFAPLVSRYNAGQVILAIASEDASAVQVIDISPMGRSASSFAFAQSTFEADADAITERVVEAWKTRSAVSYAQTARLVADVQFASLADWAKIRAQLGAVRAVSDVDIMGLALHEAEVELTYFGRPEQLIDALAQQSLSLSGGSGSYTLQLGGATAANAP
jgi:hypothetical protein